MKSSWQVATAAEAIAAAQFARFGYDVSVQYGANQPEYDLMIVDGERSLKVSVKGSRDGGWGLSQTQLTRLRKDNPDGPTDYHGAADAWLKRHKHRTAMCFVQFKNIPTDAMPRIYLVWPKDVAKRLKGAREGKGDTILWDISPEPIPNKAVVSKEWEMTAERVEHLISENLVAPIQVH
jgi:hypothetical protein